MNKRLELEVLLDVLSDTLDRVIALEEHQLQESNAHENERVALKSNHAIEKQALEEARKKLELQALEWKLRADEKTAQYNFWRNLAIRKGNLSEYDVVRYSIEECKQRQ